MLIKIMLGMAIMLMTTGGGFYWYYTHSQEQIAILNQNNASLEASTRISEATIEIIRTQQERVNKELIQINKEFADIREQNTVLASKLEKHDIGVLAAAKPGLVVRIINNASANAARCIELLSGAPLTDKEKAATTGTGFNSECPWLWTGDK